MLERDSIATLGSVQAVHSPLSIMMDAERLPRVHENSFLGGSSGPSRRSQTASADKPNSSASDRQSTRQRRLDRAFSVVGAVKYGEQGRIWLLGASRESLDVGSR